MRSPSAAGIGPVNSLDQRFSSTKLERSPSQAGIGPVNSLLLRTSDSRLVRSPSAAGIGPVNLPRPWLPRSALAGW